jgi:hypothetical protein
VGGGDEVELRFVDELDRPVEFNAFLIWEPEGEVEDVYIPGRLKIPKRRLLQRVDAWRDRLRGQQPVTENTLLTILPTSLKTGGLHYTTPLWRPTLTNKTYRVKGDLRRRSLRRAFTSCPEARVVYVSDVNIREWIPMVALADASGKAFGEGIKFMYYLDGADLKLEAYGIVSINWGAEAKIHDTYSWSSGQLKKTESKMYLPYDNQGGAVVLYDTVWREILYEVYDQYCHVVDKKVGYYLINVDTGSFLKAIDYVPSRYLDDEVAEVREYTGIDGLRVDANVFDYTEVFRQNPLIDASVQFGIPLKVGPARAPFLPPPFDSIARDLHASLCFTLFGRLLRGGRN